MVSGDNFPLFKKRQKLAHDADTNKPSTNGEVEEAHSGAEDLMEKFGLRKIASLFLRQKGSIQPKVSDTAYLAQLPMDAQIRSGKRMVLSTLIEGETPTADIRYTNKASTLIAPSMCTVYLSS